jgi:HEAT repeat protein
MQQFDKKSDDYAYAMTQALWMHQWHNRVNASLLNQQLHSDNPRARAAATRVLWAWRDAIDNPLALLKERVSDAHPWVRLEAVRALSYFRSPKAARIALQALEQEPGRYLQYTLDETMDTLDRFR